MSASREGLIVSFRPANDHDTELLWRWRLTDERRGHYEGLPTTYQTHESWFARNRDRIQVWEVGGQPVGIVRVESDGTVHFSTTADQDEAVLMVRAALGAVRRHGGRLKALVDASDEFRATVFRRAGFREFEARAMIYKGGL